ncbi:MAG: hypothetical protein LV481_01160 [Methylacidiphilales bacterium]|nr:hypothetical protein [Candidatus Methylacidiphilales bacterium]
MSTELQEHAAPAAHAFDSPEEVAHAKHHRTENNWVFAFFFILIVCAVVNYEFFGTENLWVILFLAATRVAWIAFFFSLLFRQFSYVIRTFVFAIVFLLGMIFLSMFDSTLPTFGNPIERSANADQSLFHPKPLPPAQPTPPVRP